MCFSTPQMPTPAATIPKAPEMAKEPDAGQQAQRQDDRRKLAAAYGYRGTILTGGQGLTTAAPTSTKTVLGG